MAYPPRNSNNEMENEIINKPLKLNSRSNRSECKIVQNPRKLKDISFLREGHQNCIYFSGVGQQTFLAWRPSYKFRFLGASWDCLFVCMSLSVCVCLSVCPSVLGPAFFNLLQYISVTRIIWQKFCTYFCLARNCCGKFYTLQSFRGSMLIDFQ